MNRNIFELEKKKKYKIYILYLLIYTKYFIREKLIFILPRIMMLLKLIIDVIILYFLGLFYI